MRKQLQLLCDIAELEGADGLECTVETPRGRRDLALFLHGGEVRAFVNSCPHQGRPLSWRPGAFLFDGERLVCPHHGAVFDLGSGRCLSGPCAGAALRSVAVTAADGRVVLVNGD